jgi:hypothetical protein
MFLYLQKLQVLINKKDEYKDKKNTSGNADLQKFKRVSISCLIQGINNCLQMNTYWSYNVYSIIWYQYILPILGVI